MLANTISALQEIIAKLQYLVAELERARRDEARKPQQEG
jgi:hypothetical protein